MTILSVDIETFSSIDLTKCGVYAYTEAPDFEILLFGYAFDDEPIRVIDINLNTDELLPDYVYDALINPDVIKTAFNANFERICIAKHFGLEMPPEQWRCSSVLALTLGLPTKLEEVAKVMKLQQQKDTAGKNLIRYFSIPCKPTKANGQRTRNRPEHAPEKWAQFKAYCAQDVEVERTIRKTLERFPVLPVEQKLWCLDQRINDGGIRVDPNLVTHAIACDTAYQERRVEEAARLTGLDNPKSVAQLKAWLLETEGLEVESLNKETVPELLKQAESETVKRVLGLRQEMAKTSVKKYQAMDRARCKDDRIRGLLQFYGANRTGRWAGRLVQVQNLPQNKLKDLDLARQLLAGGEYDTLELLFESVPGVLSQLIRTAFIPSPGHRFIVADFSAIEARVIAWLAGEKWRLDVFNTHGKIYEASASAMFKVPIEEITKGNPLRQKGKIAELALGYQGGKGALITMGALNMGLDEEELPGLVTSWRKANPAIVQFWWDVEKAAIEAVREKKAVQLHHGLVFSYESGILFIRLPSGRRLAYVRPKIQTNEHFDKPSLTYEGVEQGKKQWGRLYTYGGKLVENCLAGDTQVLTLRGWVPISEISLDDIVWDGIEWVTHWGAVNHGVQQTIALDGVRVTPEHLILTERGWQSASSCEGHYRAEVSLPDSHSLCWLKREEITVDNTMRLWKRISDACLRLWQKGAEILRLQKRRVNFCSTTDPHHVKTSGLLGMAVNGGPVSVTVTSSLAQLWRTWDQGVQALGEKLRGVLERYGADLSGGLNLRTQRRERGLHSSELRMGNTEKTSPKQAEQSNHQLSVGTGNGSRGFRKIWDRSDNAFISTGSQLSSTPFVCGPGREEPVYDILNAGPRHRFVVLGESGPFIVHNCVQATARDCLAESLLRLDAAEYQTVIHVHDECVLEMPYGQGSLEDACRIMGQPIPWAPGLPMRADGFECDYYKKDD